LRNEILMSLSRRQQGYSLIEVLVAFTILAMALTVLLRIFSAGLRNVDASSEYARALSIAEAELAVPGILEPLQPGITQGEEDGGYRWVRDVAEFRPIDGPDYAGTPAPPYLVTVEVTWPANQGERTIRLETIRVGAAGTIAGRIE
jgi:general secretion pathway protein I